MWFTFKMWWLKKYDRVFNPRLLRDYEPKIPHEPIDLDHFEF